MQRHAVELALSAMVVTTGCAPQRDPGVDIRIDAVARAASAAEGQVKDLGLEIDALKLRVETLESQRSSATVKTDAQGYDIARTKHGPVTVSAVGVTPFLDGFKVQLRVGNLTGASFEGAKVKVEWGLPWDPKAAQEYFKSRKSKDFSVTQTFRAGSFTDVEVAVTPAAPSEVKELEVGLQFNSMRMSR